MSKMLIDIDDRLLDQAGSVLGTVTKKDTVNRALEDVVKADLRRRHLDHLASPDGPDLLDPQTRAAAWR